MMIIITIISITIIIISIITMTMTITIIIVIIISRAREVTTIITIDYWCLLPIASIDCLLSIWLLLLLSLLLLLRGPVESGAALCQAIKS